MSLEKAGGSCAQCALLDNGGFSPPIRGFIMFLCLYFKEDRDTYIYTIEKRIHFCLFKADCLRGVLLKRPGWYFIHWVFWFSVLHSSAHGHQLNAILMEKNYVNLSYLLVTAPLPPSLPGFWHGDATPFEKVLSLQLLKPYTRLARDKLGDLFS